MANLIDTVCIIIYNYFLNVVFAFYRAHNVLAKYIYTDANFAQVSLKYSSMIIKQINKENVHKFAK